MSVAVILGTRPEIIKMAPVILELQARRIPFTILHTGQHYDELLSEIFFQELRLPKPDKFLGVGSGTQAEQTARAMMAIERELLELEPSVVLVQGDTNTVLAGALAASKAGFLVGHVEAGLRSHDYRMPEEYNRRLADHASAYLFAPTEAAAENLRKEAVHGKIFVTGNTVIDACNIYVPIAMNESKILSSLRFERFCLVTAHRAENVDDRKVLENFVEIFTRSPVPVVYPVHPRTRKLLTEFGLLDKLERSENVQLIDPVGYFDFLMLEKSCEFIMTDSGGIQEEATAPSINKKVFVLRISTERPEAVESGHAVVVGTEAESVLREVSRYVLEGCLPPPMSNPYGKGDAAKQILGYLSYELDLFKKGGQGWL
ncbi:MAG: UDP-N-acetylglucosamine 2-epimerase (non-hydrolyzing) [Thermoplasmata archaeon]